jgi:hypothetical protein
MAVLLLAACPVARAASGWSTAAWSTFADEAFRGEVYETQLWAVVNQYVGTNSLGSIYTNEYWTFISSAPYAALGNTQQLVNVKLDV